MCHNMIEKLYKIAEALNVKFPDGDDPFKIMTRLTGEGDEVAVRSITSRGWG